MNGSRAEFIKCSNEHGVPTIIAVETILILVIIRKIKRSYLKHERNIFLLYF